MSVLDFMLHGITLCSCHAPCTLRGHARRSHCHPVGSLSADLGPKPPPPFQTSPRVSLVADSDRRESCHPSLQPHSTLRPRQQVRPPVLSGSARLPHGRGDVAPCVPRKKVTDCVKWVTARFFATPRPPQGSS